MKVLTVMGTRPEIIRLSRISAMLDEYVEHIVVHTGQNYDYELSQIFFDDLSLRKPNYFLNAAGATSSATVASVLAKLDETYERERPDATLVLGDSNSCLGVYAAKRRKIPIFHVDAGKRAYDQRVPEEINRRLIDSMADVNMPCNSIARDNLLSEGFPIDRVFKIESPMYEVFANYWDKIERSDILKRLGLKAREYYVVSVHREENVDEPKQLETLVSTLNMLAKSEKKKIIFSTHPRTRKRLEAISAVFEPEIKLIRPLGFNDYNALQRESIAVLSDSGSIDEESAILNFPALNLRDSRERCEIDEAGGTIRSGLNWNRVADALKIVKRKQFDERKARFELRDFHVSEKVAQIIMSSTDYIDRVVWNKR